MQETSSNDSHRLLVQLGLSGPRAQVPAATALIIVLVLDGDFAQVTEDVLHLGVGSRPSLTAEVVKP